MARLILIRHALTDVTGRLLTGRLAGYHLNEQGQRQAKDLGNTLRTVNLHAIYASPLERTQQTADAIAQHQRRLSTQTDQVRPHPGLFEVDYGDWSGRSLASLTRLRAWKTVTTSPARMRFPGGESLTEAQQRAVATCEELAQRHRRRILALVTHADIVKLVVSYYLGQPLDLFGRVTVAPASVTVVDLPPQSPPRVVTLNSNGDPSTWQ